jgi:hypothetical protein
MLGFGPAGWLSPDPAVLLDRRAETDQQRQIASKIAVGFIRPIISLSGTHGESELSIST